MRSILGRKDNSKGNQLILGIGLIILMLFSTLGYALGGKNEDAKDVINHNGIEFIQDSSGYWKSEIQNYEFLMKYNPQEVQDIDFNGNLVLSDLENKPLYFVGESNEPIIEIARNLERFVLRTQSACVDPNACEGDLPLKNCFEDNIVIVKEPREEEYEKIYQQGNCVFIEAHFANQTKYADKFVYDLLEV
jgi:hypothetical protein